MFVYHSQPDCYSRVAYKGALQGKDARSVWIGDCLIREAAMESIFVMSAPQYGYISSSVVRQIASLGSDVSTFVPPNVVEALKHRFS